MSYDRLNWLLVRFEGTLNIRISWRIEYCTIINYLLNSFAAITVKMKVVLVWRLQESTEVPLHLVNILKARSGVSAGADTGVHSKSLPHSLRCMRCFGPFCSKFMFEQAQKQRHWQRLLSLTINPYVLSRPSTGYLQFSLCFYHPSLWQRQTV